MLSLQTISQENSGKTSLFEEKFFGSLKLLRTLRLGKRKLNISEPSGRTNLISAITDGQSSRQLQNRNHYVSGAGFQNQQI